jgi:hypothetical protein
MKRICIWNSALISTAVFGYEEIAGDWVAWKNKGNNGLPYLLRNDPTQLMFFHELFHIEFRSLIAFILANASATVFP